jgi:hypothetical protein
MRDNKNLLPKPNPALVLMPRVGKLTATGRKLYNALLKRTHSDVSAIKADGGVIDGEKLFEAPLEALLAQIVSPESKSEPRTVAKKYLLAMRRTEVDWEAPDAKTGLVWKNMGLLSEVDLEMRDGVLWVLWSLPPTLLKLLADPERRFTLLDLDMMATLDTYSAIALYEICARYRDNPPSFKTSRNTTEWWTDALSTNPAQAAKGTGVVKRREWRKFKIEFVQRAIDEVNTKTDIHVELLEFKEGRAIKEVQFEVHRKVVVPAARVPQIHEETAQLAGRLEVSLEDISKFIKEGRSNEEVVNALLRLQSRLNTTDAEVVEDRTRYLRGILVRGRSLKPSFEIVRPGHPSSEELEHVLTTAEAALVDAEQRFILMSRIERQPWIQRAIGALKARDALTPGMARQLSAGELPVMVQQEAVRQLVAPQVSESKTENSKTALQVTFERLPNAERESYLQRFNEEVISKSPAALKSAWTKHGVAGRVCGPMFFQWLEELLTSEGQQPAGKTGQGATV